MPELPEVETVVQEYAPLVSGRVIAAFVSRWPKKVRPDVTTVRRAIVGRRVTGLRRRAKFIVFDLDDGTHLLVHLRMSGRFAWAVPDESGQADEPPHARAVWRFTDGSRLFFCDARKFGVVEHVHAWADLDGRLGVEPLGPEFTAAALAKLLAARRRQLKPLLLDQRVIAGIGNIYADEALHRAGLHPLRRSDQIGPAEAAVLRRAIRAVLREAVQRNGTTFDWIYPGGQMQNHLRVYGRTGEPCRRCGTAIVALRVGQRGTHMCPRCQVRRTLGAD